MKQTTGNLWEVPSEVRVITTNGFVKSNGACVMGRGCAKEATIKYPGIEFQLGSWIRKWGNRPFRLLPDLATLPVKHNWWEVADPELIVKSCWDLMLMADKFYWTDVLVPRPGCGNGQLNWSDVQPLIAPVLDDRFTVITF